jgi:ABC-type transport system involved in Fe-S cluster assembly fused permease/ATPase subunit
MEQGQIIECGDHGTLVKTGGKYAEMFEIQAKKYRDSLA